MKVWELIEKLQCPTIDPYAETGIVGVKSLVNYNRGRKEVHLLTNDFVARSQDISKEDDDE